MIQKHSTPKFATKLKFIIKKSQQKQNAKNAQLSAFKMKTRLKTPTFNVCWKKHLNLLDYK